MIDELKQWEYDRGYAKGQADILEKIRAEVVELQKDYHEYGWTFDDVLEIIDKYKAESEGQDETD